MHCQRWFGTFARECAFGNVAGGDTQRRRAFRSLNSGRGPTEAVDAKPAKEYEAQWGDSRAFVVASFKSLWGHYAPDA